MRALGVDLQRASLWKRIAAWLLDAILLMVLAVGFGLLLATVLGYDECNQTLEAKYAYYESQYGVTLDISQDSYLAMTAQEKQAYDTAYEALIADETVLYAYNMVVNLSLVITTVGILLAMLVLEFIVPLLLHNGQTVGKKCFSLGLVRTDGVKLTALQLFVRTVLGKYTVETMIPVYILLMLFWNVMDVTGTLVLAALLIAQLVCLGVTRNRSAIHDLLAGTVAVDISSQKVFSSTEELIAYTKRIHADRAARQDY